MGVVVSLAEFERNHLRPVSIVEQESQERRIGKPNQDLEHHAWPSGLAQDGK
jgi:hypothetical protein